jgi:hypothetical protein
VGRQIFGTWEVTRSLLENPDNDVQKKVWEVILAGGQGTIVDIDAWEPTMFEAMLAAHTKVLIRFAG